MNRKDSVPAGRSQGLGWTPACRPGNEAGDDVEWTGERQGGPGCASYRLQGSRLGVLRPEQRLQ